MSLGDVTDRADVDSDESDSDESNEVRHSFLISIFAIDYLYVCTF